ncbi:MAG: LysR family transcriptional regulator [Erythrobacter sp.]
MFKIERMEPRAVRHFLAAYDAGSFTAASARLNLSPQAISKSLLRLEADLGVRLFERDGRRIRPTAYAELFLPHARIIAAETDRFRTELVDMLGGHSGRLRIGVGPSAAADIVARAALLLAEERPGTALQIFAGLQETMAEDLTLGKLDAFVALRQTDRSNPLILEEELGLMRYSVVAGAGHPLARAARVSLDCLAGARWVLGANLGAVDESIHESFRAAGVSRLRPEMETTSVLFTLAVLDAGRHLSILPEMLVKRDLRAGRLVRLDIDTAPWIRPLIVATRLRSPRRPDVTTFIAGMQAAMDDQN